MNSKCRAADEPEQASSVNHGRSLRRGVVCRLLVAAVALASWPSAAAAQESAAGMAPTNAHAKRYGRGWDCDRGYQSVDGSCATIEVPPNAFLKSNGRDWECARAAIENGADGIMAAG